MSTPNEILQKMIKLLSDHSDPLYTLNLYVSAGLTPPSDVHSEIAKRYNEYMHAGGKKSLDEAFYHRPFTKTGNHSSNMCLRRNKMHAMIYMLCMKKRYPEISKPVHAQNFINLYKLKKPDAGSLVRMTNLSLNLYIDQNYDSNLDRDEIKEEVAELFDPVLEILGFDKTKAPNTQEPLPKLLDPEIEKEHLDTYLDFLYETGQEHNAPEFFPN